jgi:two-component system, OmpR family, phosphate regulon sensor histidine kinase PhoR
MSGERILVVDDSREIVRHLSEQVLPTFGFKTLHAYDGRSGLELIRREQPDLVMLDLNLPEMTGLDILRTLVQESIDVPVILMTGYGSEKSAIEAFRLGVKDYLVKPFTVDEVIETINRALIESRLRHDKQQLAEQLRRAQAEMRRRVNEMSTLFGIGKAVSSLLSVDQVLDRVLEASIYLTNGEESTVWLSEADGTQLRAYAKKGTGNEGPQMLNLESDDSQVVQVLRTGRPVRLAAFSGPGIKIKTGYAARAVLYVPLTLHGQTIGVLSVSNISAPQAFSERDEYLLSALGDYAAIALQNARVLQAADQALAAHMDELQILIRITRTITSCLDLDEVVRLTIRQVHDSWQIEASSIWLLDENRGTLRVLANVGTPAEILNRIEVPLGRGFVGNVAQTGEWIFTNDVAHHPLHYSAVDKKTGFRTRSLLCVPLKFREKVIGTLQMLNKLDGEFDEKDVDRALSLATAVAIGVSNALLFRQAESRQQQLEAMLEHNSNPIIITDNENCLLLLNHQARALFDLSRAAIGKPVVQVVRPRELATFLRQPLADSEARRTEITLGDKSTWLATLAPIPDYGRILILQDITYLKDVDRAKSHFVATVSHDLRAPLNSIAGFATALKQSGPLNEEQALFTDRILHSSQRMADLVNGLLDLASVSAGLDQTRELCYLVEIVQQVMADLQGQALTRSILLKVTAAEPLPPVYGHPTQLRQAISNLVDNAIKYSRPEQSVHIHLSVVGNNVLLRVKDSGAGIDPVDMPRIFETFYRVKESNEVSGMGLGLTLVRSIAEAHGGRVWCQSKKNVGSIFTFQLPVANPHDTIHTENPAAATAVNSSIEAKV